MYTLYNFKRVYIMEDLEEQIAELRRLAEILTELERKRQQLKIINNTVSLGHQLNTVQQKLKLPTRTKSDVTRHTRILTELCVLFRTDEVNAPLNVIRREAELCNKLYCGLKKIFDDLLTEDIKK